MLNWKPPDWILVKMS